MKEFRNSSKLLFPPPIYEFHILSLSDWALQPWYTHHICSMTPLTSIQCIISPMLPLVSPLLFSASLAWAFILCSALLSPVGVGSVQKSFKMWEQKIITSSLFYLLPFYIVAKSVVQRSYLYTIFDFKAPLCFKTWH